MTRPASIGRFERFWWGSAGLWLLGTVLAWRRVQESLLANPQTAAVGGFAQPAIVVLVLLVTVGLWYGVARTGSASARWMVAAVGVLSGIEALMRVFGLMTAPSVHPLSLLVLLLANALSIAAAVALFRPDTRPWFGLGDPDAPGQF